MKSRNSFIRTARLRVQESLSPAFRVASDFIFWPLAKRIRRNPRRWVFGHEYGEFAGNPKFLYLWLLASGDVELHWITGSLRTCRRLRRRGWPAALRWSPRGIYLTLTAGAVFFAHRTSDVNASLVRGAFLVNLWHCVGLKSIQLGWDSGNTVRRRAKATSAIKRAFYRSFITDPDIVVTTSDFMQVHFADQFKFPPDRCPMLGYPRLDPGRDRALACLARSYDERFVLRPAGFDEAYLYAPTWRDSNRPFLEDALPDFARLDAELARRNALLYVKLHPATKDRTPEGSARIVTWPPGADIYDYLPDIEGLITDYSSIFYDFLALRSQPAVIYAFDLEDYLAKDRTLLYPFEENVVGLWAHNFDELCDVISRGLRQPEPDAWKADEIRRKFWGDDPGIASARIHNFVRARLANAPSLEPLVINRRSREQDIGR